VVEVTRRLIAIDHGLLTKIDLVNPIAIILPKAEVVEFNPRDEDIT
jgi:hypothetical protein